LEGGSNQTAELGQIKVPKSRGISQRRSRFEVAVSRATAGLEEVDDAHLSLAGSTQPLHRSLAGSDAGAGEGGVMKAQNPSKSLGEGRDVAPSLAHPSQKQNLVVYTEELTHLAVQWSFVP
jgi:hypothetical protein